MRRLLHYLFSLAVHLISFGLGRRRPLSSIPLTRGKAIPVKPIPGWQIFIALWLLQKLWSKYGSRITSRVKQHSSKYCGPGASIIQQFLYSFNPKNFSPKKPRTITVEPLSHHAES